MRQSFAVLLLLFSTTVFGYKKLYVSPTGDDTKAGTISAPFKNWDHLSGLLSAGDTAILRGGTYRSAYPANSSVHCYLQNLHGTLAANIVIMAMPGEFPVLDLSNLGVPTYSDPNGVYMLNCSFVKLLGRIRVTGLAQNQSGNGISRGFSLVNSPNNIIENVEVDHIGGGAFHVYDNSDNVLFLNCDAHHNDDRFSNPSPWGGADGFSRTGGVNSTNTIFDGCRSWDNSDDGYDFFKTDGTVILKNCQSMHNGYEPGTNTVRGNGDGFKLGPASDVSASNRPAVLKVLQNCLAFDNASTGFDQNGTPTMLYQLYNNTAFRNKGDGFNFQFSPTGTVLTLKNNVAVSNTLVAFRYIASLSQVTNNSWSGLVTANASDFLSTDTTGATGPRQTDGSLPNLDFMKLAATSDLINAGTPVGLPYISIAPDMGCYEFSPSNVVLPTANAGPDQNLKLPFSTIKLSGTATGTGVTYYWSKVSGPTQTKLYRSNLRNCTAAPPTVGQYVYRFTVIDENGIQTFDDVTINVTGKVKFTLHNTTILNLP